MLTVIAAAIATAFPSASPADPQPVATVPAQPELAGDPAPLPSRSQEVAHPSRKPSPPGTNVPITANPRLFGDWGGVLPKLSARGIVPTLSVVGEFGADAAGAPRHDATLVWQINAGITADLRKTMGLPGMFQATITKRDGPLLDRQIGVNLLQFSQGTFGRGRIWRLTAAFWQDRIGPIDLKLGRVAPGDDFNAGRGDFMSLYLVGSATGHIAHNLWYNFPVSQWGGRALINVAPDKILAVGLYQVDPRNIDPEVGFSLRTNGDIGILLPVEARFVNPLGKARPGIVKAGFFYSNAKLPDIAFDTDGRPQVLGKLPRAIDNRHWGVFGNVQQTLIPPRPDGSGAVSTFVNATWTTSGASTMYGKLGAGIAATGLIPSRPVDELAVGIGLGRINDHLTRLDEALCDMGRTTLAPRRSEQMVEVYYGFNVRKGLVVRPNMQLWRHPGGHPDARPLVIVGAKTVANF